MSVLSDLFQAIAVEIKAKTGKQDMLTPMSFPDEIRSIVTSTIVGGGESGGNIRIASGTFGESLESDPNFIMGRQTITHGLGEKPDLICVFPGITFDHIPEGGTSISHFTFAFGTSTRFPIWGGDGSNNYYGQCSIMSSDANGYTILGWGMKHGIDVPESGGSPSWIYTPDDQTFKVGGSGNASFAGMYRWIAIAGMGGDYPAAENTTF